MASEKEPEEHVRNFMRSAYSFLDDLIDEITEEITDNNVILPAFNVFNPNNVNKTPTFRQDQIEILLNRYGNSITDVYENHSIQADALVSIEQQRLETDEYFQDFDDVASRLTNSVKTEARKLMNLGKKVFRKVINFRIFKMVCFCFVFS